MSNSLGQDKTEKATPRRRDDARKEGNVARSMDVNSVVILFTGIMIIKAMGYNMLQGISDFMSSTYMSISSPSINVSVIPSQAMNGIGKIALILLPILSAIMVAGLLSNIVQVGIGFSPKAIQPKFSKISPLKGFKRMFSAKSLVEFAKGIFKIFIVGGISYSVINGHLTEYLELAGMTPWMILSFLAGVLFELTIKIAVVLIFLAAADYAWQKYEYEKNLKMTKQEVKDELKQYEGNPEIKSRIRSVQQASSRNRMMQAVPDATVVVTNPTHLAIALLYEPSKSSDAPKIIAMGQRKTAERIKKIAQEANVPIIENKPLARTLFKSLEVGMEIPSIFYEAVAEILAQVFKMQRENPKLKKRVNYGN